MGTPFRLEADSIAKPYAERAEPRRSVSHDELVLGLCGQVARLSPDDVARAFVAALRPRRFAHWSTFASFSVARGMPTHAFRPLAGRRNCAACGAFERVDVFASDAFARLRARADNSESSPRYALYDLETFATETFDEPDDADRACFDAAVSRIARIGRDGAVSAAEAALGTIFASRLERKYFLRILGLCGVMATPAHPGFWPRFVALEDRAPANARPYAYPVTSWERRHGLRLDALRAAGLERYLTPATRDSLSR